MALFPVARDLFIAGELEQARAKQPVDDASDFEVGAVSRLWRVRRRDRLPSTSNSRFHSIGLRDISNVPSPGAVAILKTTSIDGIFFWMRPTLQAGGPLHDHVLDGNRKPDVFFGDLGHRFELELTLVPAHEVEDGVLHLLLDERLEDLLGDVALVDQDLTQPPPFDRARSPAAPALCRAPAA